MANVRKFKVGDFVKHRKNEYLAFRVLEVSEPPGDALYRCLSVDDDSTLRVYAEEDLYRIDPSDAGVYTPIQETATDSTMLEHHRTGTYEVQTVVPFKDNPTLRLYVLSHRQLQDFLHGRGGSVEEVVSVTRTELPAR